MIGLFASGVALGMLFYELTGLSPGGIVVPGYIALYANQPHRLLVTVVIAIATWGLGRLSSRFLFLYGRVRFGTYLLIAMGLRAGLDLLINKGFWLSGWDALGMIIPGLIANEFERQGVFGTLAAMVIVGGTLFLVRFLTGWP